MEVNQMSYRVWRIEDEKSAAVIYFDKGFRCTCPIFQRKGVCNHLRALAKRLSISVDQSNREVVP